jgi:hypothetical protein
LQLNLPIVTVTRSGFAETQLLLDGLQDYGQHRILAHPEFFESDWDFIAQPFTPPRQTAFLPQNGKQTIAEAVCQYLISVLN